MSARRGAILAELAVALMIAAVAAAIGTVVLVAAERTARRQRLDDRTAQTTADALRALESDVVASLADSLRIAGDTAVDVYAPVGVAVTCGRSPRRVVLAPVGERRLAWWRALPEAGDLAVAVVGEPGGVGAVDSARTDPAGRGCPTATGFRTAADSSRRLPTTELFLAAEPDTSFAVGAPVRVFRPLRWLAYRGGDGEWALGQRRCPAAHCASVQPVAGPLATRADSGFIAAMAAPGVVRVVLRPLGAAAAARVTLVAYGAHAPR